MVHIVCGQYRRRNISRTSQVSSRPSHPRILVLPVQPRYMATYTSQSRLQTNYFDAKMTSKRYAIFTLHSCYRASSFYVSGTFQSSGDSPNASGIDNAGPFYFSQPSSLQNPRSPLRTHRIKRRNRVIKSPQQGNLVAIV